MDKFSAFVGIISSLCGVVGLIITMINSKKIGKFGIIMIAIILVAVIGTGVFFSTSTTIIPHPPKNPFASQPIPTATSTEPIPTATPTKLTLAGTKTLSENVTLKCVCSDPVVITITTIVIQPELNRMLWSLTLNNVSQSSANFDFGKFSLQVGDQINNPPGPVEQTYSPTGPGISPSLSLQAGQTQNIKLTFTFGLIQLYPILW